MEKLREFIEKKKEKSASKKPRYGTRKLSVGLVSCVLGYCIFLSPTVVSAQVVEGASEVASIETSVDAGSEATETKETEAVVDTNETPVAEVTEIETPAEEVAETETPAEEVAEEKSEPVEAEEKTEAPVSEEEALAADEKEATLAEEATETETKEEAAEVVEEKSAEEVTEAEAPVEELEVSDNVEAEELRSEATPYSAETGVIQNVEITIGGSENGDKTTTVNPTANDDRTDGKTDLNLKARVDFDIPEGTKSGSTFDVLISDNVNFKGIVKDEEVPNVYYNGDEIATGEKLTGEKRGYKYTFIDAVNGLADIRVRLEYPLFIDPVTVPNDSPKETVKVTLAGEDGTVIGEGSKDFAVEYEKGVYEVDPEAHTVTVSGSANITNVTENTYEHVIYVNPTGDQGLTGSHLEIKNQEYEETYTDDYGTERTRKKAYDGAIFDEDVKNSVKVYKIIDKDNFNLSYDLIESNLEDVTANAKVDLIEDLWGGPSYLKVNVNQENYDDSVYVVTYNGKRKPNQATKTNVEFTADDRQMEGYETAAVTKVNGGWFWTNDILFDDPETVAIANEVYNLGDRVWIDTNKNGIQDEDEKGLANVKVTLKTHNPDDMLPITIQTDEKGNYIFKKLRTGDYVVEFELPEGYEPTQANQGTDGAKDSDAVVADNIGKVLVKLNSAKAGKPETDNTQVTTTVTIYEQNDSGEYVEVSKESNMDVDFGVIQIEQPGSFQEHHIYITKDQDGVETGRTSEDGELQEGKKEESYTTSKAEKDGFTLVRTETPVEEPTYNEDGSEATGNYKPGVKQEITYVYEKTVNDPQKEPGSFIEHHIYITKDQDGVETGRKEEDGKLQEGKKEESYTTSKVEKDGFTLVRTETPVEEPTYNEDGSQATGNYKPGVKQEITYVYEKTVKDETPTPVTPPTPEEPKKPNESPLVPLTPAEPVKPKESTPLTRDHKIPGTPVVTEVPPTKVIEIEKTPEEKPEESKEVEKKEVKVEEVKEEAKTLEEKNLEKAQAPEVEKISSKTPSDDKAPKTGDAGTLSSLGLSSLAASGLAFIELKKRNKKNK